MTALAAPTHLSTIASKNNPMHVPTIAPALAGTHPWNHSTSPGVKCRYDNMLPEARSIAPSMDMSMPLLAACATGAKSAHRQTR